MKIKTKLGMLCSVLSVLLLFAAARTNAGQACGTASISSVVGTGCVQSTTAGQNQFWDIAEGGTYTITLSGVTECTGDTINVIVHSSSLGNICTTATGSGGTYTFTYTAPANGCFTEVIEYCTTDCQPGTGKFANDQLGGCIGHLRFATFDGNCAVLSTDIDCGGVEPKGACVCGGTPQITCVDGVTAAECVGGTFYVGATCADFEVLDCGTGGAGCSISGPNGGDLGCNPTSVPDCSSVTTIFGGCIQAGSFDCSATDSVNGCVHSRHIVASVIGCDGTPCNYDQTFTWTVATGPVFAGCNNIIARAPDVGSCCKNVSFTTPTATDPCTGAPLTVSCDQVSPVNVCVGTPVTVTCSATTATCSVEGSCSFTVTLERCPLTQGYWKTHALATWPCQSLVLGTVSYDASHMLCILKKSVGSGSTGNALLILADQLITAKENECNIGVCGGDAAGFGACADAAIVAADALIGSTLIVNANCTTFGYVKVSSPLGQLMVAQANILNTCNNTCTATQ